MSRTNAAGEVCDPQGHPYPDGLLNDQELLDKVERNIRNTEKMAQVMGCPPPSFSMSLYTAQRLLTLAQRGMPNGTVTDVESVKEIAHEAGIQSSPEQ